MVTPVRLALLCLAALMGFLVLADQQSPQNETTALAEQSTTEEADAVHLHARIRECRRASGAIVIDGKANEAAWATAEVIEGFSPFWENRAARTKTKARLLWDDDHLYFFAELEDEDLYADLSEHDERIWENDVFELFFKPDENRSAYYEFQVNAKNTVLDMFLASRGSGGYRRWAREREFHLQTAVEIRGSLNRWEDTDNGWSVEGLIPWSDFAATGGRPDAKTAWKFTLCRYDYSKQFEQPELSSSAQLTKPNFHRYEDYDLLRFVPVK